MKNTASASEECMRQAENACLVAVPKAGQSPTNFVGQVSILPMVNGLCKVAADRDIRPANFVGQVSIPADGEWFMQSCGG